MPTLKGLFAPFRPKAYARRPALVLLNGLAEQPESWFRNKRYWSRYFEVHAPNFLLYDGALMQERIAQKLPVDIDYLVGQLHAYLTQFVQTPPYHICASSLGGKIAVEFAVKYPHLVNRMVLLCPSGMGDKEKLPVMEGLKGGGRNMPNVVKSVFNNRRTIDRDMMRFFSRAIENRKWKKGLVRLTNATLEHSVRAKMSQIKAHTLLVTCDQDQICDPATAKAAADEMPAGRGHFLMIPGCGHAPQIERHWLINRLVVLFLSSPVPTTTRRLTQLL